MTQPFDTDIAPTVSGKAIRAVFTLENGSVIDIDLASYAALNPSEVRADTPPEDVHVSSVSTPGSSQIPQRADQDEFDIPIQSGSYTENEGDTDMNYYTNLDPDLENVTASSAAPVVNFF